MHYDIWRLDSIQEVHDVVDIIWPGSVCRTTFFGSNAYIAPPATAIVMGYGIFNDDSTYILFSG